MTSGIGWALLGAWLSEMVVTYFYRRAWLKWKAEAARLKIVGHTVAYPIAGFVAGDAFQVATSCDSCDSIVKVTVQNTVSSVTHRS